MISIDLPSLRDDIRRRHCCRCGAGIKPTGKDREHQTANKQTAPESISDDLSQDIFSQSPIIASTSRQGDALARAAAMDNPVGGAYFCSMLARFVTLFSILAISVIATVSTAHAARMGVSMQAEHAMHVGMMLQVDDRGVPSCDGDQGCGMADAGDCAFLCAGLVAYMPLPCRIAERSDPPMRHEPPATAISAGSAPGLNERPPKLCLL